MNAQPARPEDTDVQGLIKRAYGNLTEATYLLLRVRDAQAALVWIRSAPITYADVRSDALTAMQIAFTAPGLRALGVPDKIVEAFPHEFVTGMSAEPNRSRRLGDVGANAPDRWWWGKPGEEPHVAVLLFAQPGRLPALRSACKAAWGDAFEVVRQLGTINMSGKEPFGFRDGISQPHIDWKRELAVGDTESTYRNESALGEFVLGYPNEYRRYTERPLLCADADSEHLLPAEEQPHLRDLGRNGTYMVLRQLEQNVAEFTDFTSKHAVTAEFVGRDKDGTLLAQCPVGAHIRRANPRNADFVTPPKSGIAKALAYLGFGSWSTRTDLLSSVRFHRILRRGREYRHGLHFLCLNANIVRQFEFVQNAWLASRTFNGLWDENDPLVGTPPRTFTVQQEQQAPRRVEDVPQFVTVRGGAYFFLPSRRALEYFVRVGARREVAV